MKFHQNIFNAYQVVEWTQFLGRTDRLIDRQMEAQGKTSPNPVGGDITNVNQC